MSFKENFRNERLEANSNVGIPRTWSNSFFDVVQGNRESLGQVPLCYMELILTSNCNLRCSYCFEKNKLLRNMPDEVAFKAVDFFIIASRKTKNLTILLFGGEPMLRFDLIQRLVPYANAKANACGKSISWDMTTNGTLITEQQARWLADNKVKYLLSLDGAREDHDRYRKFPDGRGSYELIIQRLPIMKRYQPWMGTKVSVTPESTGRMYSNMLELWQNGINQFIIGYAHGLNWTDEALLGYERGMMDICELYLKMKHSKNHFRITSFEESELCKVEKDTFGCGAGRGRFCVDPLGDMYGCSKMCTIAGTGNGVLPFGNIYQGFTQIHNRRLCLNSSIAPRLKCQCCELKQTCGGGCLATNFIASGHVFIPDDVACKVTFINKQINRYMRRRHDEVFGTNWTILYEKMCIDRQLPTV